MCQDTFEFMTIPRVYPIGGKLFSKGLVNHVILILSIVLLTMHSAALVPLTSVGVTLGNGLLQRLHQIRVLYRTNWLLPTYSERLALTPNSWLLIPGGAGMGGF